MSEYRIRSTGEVKTQGELRKIHSNTSFPRVWGSNVCDAIGVDPVLASPQPTPSGPYKVVTRNGVTQDNLGNWVQAWIERDMFSDYTDSEGVLHTKAEQEAAYQAGLNEQVREAVVVAVQKRLDDFAATKNYSGILSACTYATSTNPIFQPEGQYCVEARDATWAKCYQILTEVQLQLRPMPNSYDDIEAELPVLAWP